MTRNKLKCKERKDIVGLSIERNVELSWVELDDFVVVCVYRPPTGDFSVFESTIEDVLRKCSNKNKSVIVCGDFNVNLLESSSVCTRLISLFKSSNLHHQFLEPTRITATSATCLDNVFCNRTPDQKSIITCLTSDHCGQRIKFYLSNAGDKLTPITYRPVPISRLDHFQDTISAKLSKLTYTPDDPNKLYTNFFKCFKTEFDVSFPIKKRAFRNKSKFSDWATPGVYKSRNRLYELYDLRQYKQRSSFMDYVRKYSKLFKKVCNQAKAIHIGNRISNSNNKIKTTWEVINRESGKTKRHDSSFCLNKDGKVLKDDDHVAAAFEVFYKYTFSNDLHIHFFSFRS